MPGTVTNQTTLITNAEAGDGGSWDDIGGGQGSGQNTDVFVQGTESRGRRRDNQSGGMLFDNVTSLDLSAAGTHVGMWIQTLQPGTIGVNGFRMRLGDAASDAAPWSEWEVLTSSNYPASGGFVRVWLDPTRTATATNGTLTLTSVRQYGVNFDMGNVGGNALNCIIDAIHILDGGGGLLIDSGTVPSPATFQDFVDADQGTSTAQYGIVQTRDGVVFCLARLTIADATATVFNDSGFVLVFADQEFVSSDFMGLTIDLQNASTTVDFADAIIRSGGSVNLGDLVVSGTSGLLNYSAVTLDNLRIITLTSACTLSSCIINNSGLVTLDGASIAGTSIANSTASSAVLWDTNNDPSTELADTSYTSGGTGHAIELGTNTPTVITFNGHSYNGYAGVDGSSGNEVLFNNSGKAITVNVVGGGDVPSVRNGVGASTTVVANTQITLTGLVNPTEVRVYEQGTNNEVAGQEDVTTGTFQFSDSANDIVDIRIFSISYEPADILGFTVPSNDTTLPIQQRFDRNYVNP